MRPLGDQRLRLALGDLVGNGGARDDVALGERHRPLERVFQLADVAGPIVGQDHFLGFWSQRLRPFGALGGDVGEEFFDEDRNIVAAIAQRGQMNVDDVEPVVEIGAEAPALDVVFQIAVRRRHDAHVHRNGFGAADGDRFALLQHAEQLHLGRRRHLADFIEEERAAAGGREQSLLVADRARERALHVTEQLRLEQALGQRAAVE